MRPKLTVIALGIVVVASAFGASAFTTGSVDRTATIDVKGDSSGLIGLEAGDTSFVTDSNGELAIDVSSGDSGVNPNANYTIGSQSESSPAFNITNNFGSEQSFEIEYSLDDDTNITDSNLQFQIHNNTGSEVETVKAGADPVSLDPVSEDATYGVVIEIDTDGLTKADDLSGSLNVSA